MPTNLTSLIKQKTIADWEGDRSETNLEKGQIFVFSPGNVRTNFCNGFCWRAPGTGCVVMEVWGAGGSSSRMCCCGWGMPGNAGAYSRKCFCVTSGCYVTGVIGFSCGNADTIFFRGCSEATCVCWFGNGTNGCICSQGGRAGCSICATDGTCGGYCCYRAVGYCGSNNGLGQGMGTICNIGTTQNFIATAVGGDLNLCGGVSCVTFACSCPTSVGRCCYMAHVPGPAGVWSCCNTPYVSYTFSDDSVEAHLPGQGLHGFIIGLSTSRNGTKGSPHPYSWRNDRICSCYESMGCVPYAPYGWGGAGTAFCGDVRDVGVRGGQGAVKIKFFS